ncbi:MAG: hypothetical protein Q8J68_08020 [Methanolobus sp.]|uniref:hypothetical protein n=1 Tax=Methanolobus sp. TaxID=1874737 RepID=UPI002730490B|nr:hypothetical protein [Methanolobus sp.]MDP2217215.1 hypothetical protein [Methanolobus sp.]
MSFGTKIRPYAVLSLSLAGARADSAQGVITLVGVSKATWKINTLTVITLGGGTLSVKLNSSSGDSITLSDGFKIEGILIDELYWTNSAQVGKTAEIFAAWAD